MHLPALLLVVVFVICGCSSTAPPAPPAAPAKPAAPSAPAPSTPADQRAAVPAALAVERKWLQAWFQGTPVLIEQRNDGTLAIEVPREFCFEPGSSSVKPALAAVLNKAAESMLRVPLARLPLVAAPADEAGAEPLALQRAAQVQKHLLARGVPAARLGKPSVSSVAAVQLRMQAAAP